MSLGLSSIRRIAKSAIHLINLLNLALIRGFLKLLPHSRKRIGLTYKAQEKLDGLGAQLQRLLGTRAVSAYLDIEYVHNEIEDVAIHPLDGIETSEQRKAYLLDINDIFAFSSTSTSLKNISFSIDDLSISDLWRALFLSLTGQTLLIAITHPFRVVDLKPEMYRLSISDDLRTRLLSARSSIRNAIAIHHRQGTGNFAIQPGQKSPRELTLISYLAPLKSLSSDERLFKRPLSIFTDASDEEFRFEPPVHQREQWIGLPNFDGKSIVMNRHNLSAFFKERGFQVEIESGGNPLDSLARLSNSDVLVLSRSSFGYVAALLSKNSSIFLPSDFWHPKLKGWKTFRP